MGSVVLLLTAAFVCCTQGLPTASRIPPTIKGYTYLGTGSSYGGTETRAGITYYISQHALPQFDALGECISMGGELLSILNPKQDEEIRNLLMINQLSGETIWTSGSYDSYINQWVWASNKKVVNYSNFRNPVSNPNSSSGITISGHLTSYGWNAQSSNQCFYKYICTY